MQLESNSSTKEGLRWKVANADRMRRGGSGGPQKAIDVSGISQFQPRFLQGLVFWFTAEESYVRRQTLSDYVAAQPADVRTQLLEHFSQELGTQVLTELKSNTPELPNSLVPLELDSATSTGFPSLMHRTDAPNAIVFPSDGQHLILTTSQPLLLPDAFTQMTISKGIELEYISSLQSLLVRPTSPDAELSELIVYNRTLPTEELQQLEGYVAYRKNEQWKLSASHPYFPEVPSIPEDGLKILDDIVIIRRQILQSDPSDLTKIPVKDGCIRRTHELESMVKQAALFLRRSGQPITSNAIFQQIPILFAAASPPATEAAFRAELNELLALVGLIEPDAMQPQTGGGTFAAPDPIQDAKNEEYLALSAMETAGREFYRPLRQVREALTLHGERLVGRANQALRAELQTMAESMEILWSEALAKDSALREQLEPLTAKFSSGEWTRDLREFDSTELPDSTAADRKYRDPFLQSVYDRWTAVQTELSRGDAAYCVLRIARAMDAVKRLLAAFETNSILFYHGKTYKTYCMQKFKELEQFHQVYQTIAPGLKRSIQDLETLIAKTVQIQRPPVDQSDPWKPQFTQLHHTEPITIRRVTADDSFVTGIEWIQTDASGELNPAELHLVFPTWEDLSGGETQFTAPTTFFDGQRRIEQVVRCIPTSDTSILGLLTPDLLPEVFTARLQGLHELSRLQWNAIHRLRVDPGSEPVCLPKYGLTQGAYYVIRNDGPTPFCIQIPGAPDLTISVGPAEVIVCIAGPDELEHDSLYGIFPLLPNLLPYDTLFGTPRSRLCCWVPEVSSFVYLLQELPPQPLLDSSGHLIAVQKAPDGFVYDYNDSLHCNPYVVRTLPEQSVASLGNRSVRPVSMDSIRVRSERRSGLAALCDASGIPLFNEFGITRIATAPLLMLGGGANGPNLHMRTAEADTIVVPMEGTVATPYLIEPFLSFRTLFRSHFAVPSTAGGFLFVSPTELPLAAPDGALISAPANLTKVSETEYAYLEGGASQSLYLLTTTARDLPAGRPFAFVDTALTLPALKTLQEALMVLKRVQLTGDAFASMQEFIKQQKLILSAFGPESTQQVIQLFDDISAELSKSQEELRPLQELVEPLKIRLVSVPIPDDVQGSLQTLEVQLQQLTEKVQSDFKLVERTISTTNGFVRRIGALQSELERLRPSGEAAFATSFQTVQTVLQKQLAERQTSSVPELEEFLAGLATTQERFRKRLAELEAGLAARPRQLSEVDAWIRGLEHSMVAARADVAHAKHVVGQPLFTVLKDLQSAARDRISSRAKELLASVRNFVNPLAPLRVWYGLETRSPPLPAPWSSVYPVFRNGGTVPSLEGDWAPLAAAMDQPLRETLEKKLQRGRELKTGLQTFLTQDPFQGYEELRSLDVDASNVSLQELRHHVGTLELLAADLTAKVESVETVHRAFMEELIALEPQIRTAFQTGPVAKLKELADTVEAYETRRIAVETVARTLPTGAPPPASLAQAQEAIAAALDSVAQPEGPLSRFLDVERVYESQLPAVQAATQQLDAAAAQIQAQDADAVKELQAKWDPLYAEILRDSEALKAKPIDTLPASVQLYIRQTIPATLAKLEAAPKGRYGEFLDAMRAAEVFRRSLAGQLRAAGAS